MSPQYLPYVSTISNLLYTELTTTTKLILDGSPLSFEWYVISRKLIASE